jgi:DNA-3-methyladenine glycosylase
VASSLLHCRWRRVWDDGTDSSGYIDEVEAYHQVGDAASHSFKGKTARNSAMFSHPGTVYVYRIYGVHLCVNLVCEAFGIGAAVLVRALSVDRNLEKVAALRPQVNSRGRLDGPAKVTQGLAIPLSWCGQRLDDLPWSLSWAPRPEATILETPRIGISQARDLPWRFVLADSLKGRK